MERDWRLNSRRRVVISFCFGFVVLLRSLLFDSFRLEATVFDFVAIVRVVSSLVLSMGKASDRVHHYRNRRKLIPLVVVHVIYITELHVLRTSSSYTREIFCHSSSPSLSL